MISFNQNSVFCTLLNIDYMRRPSSRVLNGQLRRTFRTDGDIRFFLLELSPDLPIWVGIGVNIDIGFTRFDKLHQII